MACGGSYTARDPSIVAVSLARLGEWQCGSHLDICGPAGCIAGTMQDTCPGCAGNHLDLSDAGMALVCGPLVDICNVRVQPMRLLAPGR
jgi:hypothetical protein